MIKVNENERRRVERKLSKLVKSMDFTKEVEKMLKSMKEEARSNILQQGRIYGDFKSLASSTAKKREAAGYSPYRPVMVRDGTLMNSFEHEMTGKNKGYLTNESGYALYHQKGMGSNPQRVLMDVSDKQRKAMAARIGHKLMKKALGSL
jgi:hypothetical protein